MADKVLRSSLQSEFRVERLHVVLVNVDAFVYMRVRVSNESKEDTKEATSRSARERDSSESHALYVLLTRVLYSRSVFC